MPIHFLATIMRPSLWMRITGDASYTNLVTRRADQLLYFINQVFGLVLEIMGQMLEVSARSRTGLRCQEQPGAGADHKAGHKCEEAH